jgi:hypothetical protein
MNKIIAQKKPTVADYDSLGMQRADPGQGEGPGQGDEVTNNQNQIGLAYSFYVDDNQELVYTVEIFEIQKIEPRFPLTPAMERCADQTYFLGLFLDAFTVA